MKIKFILGLVIFSTLLITSCRDKEEKTFSPDSSYEASTFSSNPLRSVAQSLIDMEDFLPKNRPGNNNANIAKVEEISSTTLNARYEVGTPNVLGIASDEFKKALTGVLFPAYQINRKATADGTAINWDDLSASPNGGGFRWIFNANGVEIEQIIMKGGFIGVSFHHVKNTLFKDLKAVGKAELDAALDLYGSEPTFEATPQTAKYTKPRTKNGTSFHTLIQQQFIQAESAINQGFEAEKVQALENILSLWQEGLAAQAIFYAYDVIDYFSKAEVTHADIASGCHAWSEGVGIIMGFYKVDNTIINDAQVVSFLSALKAQTNGLGTPTDLVKSVSGLAEVETAIDNLATIFKLNKNEHRRNI